MPETEQGGEDKWVTLTVLDKCSKSVTHKMFCVWNMGEKADFYIAGHYISDETVPSSEENPLH